MDPTTLIKPDYLGDGVYVGFDGYHIICWTERISETHWIAFEPGLINRLKEYEERLLRSIGETEDVLIKKDD